MKTCRWYLMSTVWLGLALVLGGCTAPPSEVTPTSTPTNTPESTATPAATPTAEAPPIPQPGAVYQIAFVSDRDGDDDIYLIDSDGSNLLPLTDNTTPDSFPAWSPDGSRIAYVSELDEHRTIHVMNADGSNTVEVTPTHDVDGTFPTWSPDGSQIAFKGVSYTPGFVTIGGKDIYVVSVEDSSAVSLTSDLTKDTSLSVAGGPVWSPDGQHIAFVMEAKAGGSRTGAGLYIMDRDGGNKRLLADQDAINLSGYYDDFFRPIYVFSLTFSPDSRSVLFTGILEGGAGIYGIGVDDPASTFSVPVGGLTTSISLSPDGTSIAYTDPDTDVLWVSGLDGSNARQLHDNGLAARWSPDGAQILFVSAGDIYVIAVDGSQLRNLTDGPDTEKAAAWRP